MTTTHKLKIWPRMFDAVRRGDKTFEIRKNDRDYQTGDILELEEWDPAKAAPAPAAAPWATAPSAASIPVQPAPPHPGYTGRTVTVRVTYTLHGGRFGVQGDYVVMSIERIENVRGEELCEDIDIDALPVPPGVYWHVRKSDFVGPDGMRKGPSFYRQWMGRWGEFPTSSGVVA